MAKKWMNLVDSILNIALLFLWIDWRSGRIVRQPQPALSLANTVRPTERKIGSGLGSLGVLVFILLVRPCFYYSIGSKLSWTPEIDLLAVSLPWRSDLLDRMYVYSTSTFLLTLGAFYAAMLLLSVVNRKLPDSDVIQRFVRLQLGWIERFPWPVRLLLPFLVAGFSWAAVTPLLVAMGILPSLPPVAMLCGQSLAFAPMPLLGWKWLLIVIFVLHLLNIYVYLGTHPAWPYISSSARSILRPLSFLTFTKLDFAPVVGIALVYCLAEFAIKPAILQIFHRFSA
jgi:hypothetical protein